ncbi:hypothetical protein GCAAIG_13850 [Candidatus Electronema halotolerans]|jgi:hypothetical protein
MSIPFTSDQLASLSAQIDRQLAELQADPSTAVHKGGRQDKQENPELLPVQWRVIEKITKEEPRSFWQRFKKAAHNDLCKEDGVLNTQWRKWGDLSNEAVLKSFGALLVGMGFSGNALQVLAVALAVIVIHLGCTAICKEA